MKNIAYLHQYFRFPNEPGGTRSYDLARGFVAKNYKVEIITTTSDIQYKNGRRWNSIQREDLLIHYIYLPYSNKLSYFKRSIIFFQFFWFSTIKLLSLKPDLVLATSTPLTIGIPALIKKVFHGTSFIFEARDIWPEAVIAIGAIRSKVLQRLLYWLEGVIYRNAKAIIPLSSDMKYSIVSRYPQLLEKPVQVIENISEINRFQNISSKRSSILKEKLGFIPRFTILYAGTFGKVNGIEYVIQLAEKIITIDPSIVFVLIGNGAEKNNIMKSAKEKNLLHKNVFILDAITKNELPQLYYEANMGSSFVIDLKELWANSANKFFDTLAAGRPILINHHGWQEEIIRKDNLGYVLPPRHSPESINEFVLYTKNEDLQIRQKENALKKAIESYSLEIAVKKYTMVFSEILPS